MAEKKAQVQNKPAITKRQQWLDINPEYTLLDTPGILWPKFEDEKIGMHLALTGTLKDKIINQEIAARHLVSFLKEKYPHLLRKRYSIEKLANNDYEIIDQIAKAKHFRIKDAELDLDRTYLTLLLDFKSGRIGRISLENSPTF